MATGSYKPVSKDKKLLHKTNITRLSPNNKYSTCFLLIVWVLKIICYRENSKADECMFIKYALALFINHTTVCVCIYIYTVFPQK